MQNITIGISIANLLLTFFIAQKQIQINRNNLKLNLYERRYKIYEATINFIKDFIYELSSDQLNCMNLLVDYRDNVHQSIFLFDDKMEKYLLKIFNTSENIIHCSRGSGDYLEKFRWLEKQKVDARYEFKRYMKFKS